MKRLSNSNDRPFLYKIVFCCFLLISITSLLATPRIEVEQPLWNFGAITNFGDVTALPALTHDFVIRNTGDTPLVISQVLSSCNVCLQAEMANREISSGGSNVIHCHLDLRLLSGSVTREVLVECNDPVKPSLTVMLAGVVVPVYQVVPPEISLNASEGQMVATAEISPLVPLRARLSQVSCDDTNMDAGISIMLSDRFLLAVRLKTMPPRGDSVARLTLRTADTNDPQCKLTVAIHHPEDLEWLPAKLVFQPLAGEQVRVLWLSQHGTNPLTLLDAFAASNKFHCEIEPLGWNYRIYVTAVGQEATAGQTNALLLKFKNAANERTNVYVPMSMEAP